MGYLYLFYRIVWYRVGQMSKGEGACATLPQEISYRGNCHLGIGAAAGAAARRSAIDTPSRSVRHPSDIYE